MDDRCEPPAELRDVSGWHWLADQRGRLLAVYWQIDYVYLLDRQSSSSSSPQCAWIIRDTGFSAEFSYECGYRYLCPVPAAKTRERILTAALVAIVNQGPPKQYADIARAALSNGAVYADPVTGLPLAQV